MTTLADMTEEERKECVGMWCGYNRHLKGGEPSDFVIMVEDVNEAGRVPCINPGAPEPKAWAPDPWMLTPRADLPRLGNRQTAHQQRRKHDPGRSPHVARRRQQAPNRPALHRTARPRNHRSNGG